MSTLQIYQSEEIKNKVKFLILLKNFIGKLITKKQKAYIWLIINYIYDCQRLMRSAAISAGGLLNTDDVINQANLKALITMEYHRIEKALSLKETRTAFGTTTIQRLIEGIETYQNLYGSDRLIQIAINNLIAYYEFNCRQGHEDKHLEQTIKKLQHNSHKSKTKDNIEGGIIEIKKEDIWQKAKLDLGEFFACRYSIRNFTDEEVDYKLLEQAVKMAQKTPSVCNRQSSKVYVFSTEENKNLVLSYQNGNRGFGHLVNKVLIITSNLENFVSVGERNQCWIDGGMYAMSLVYALHSLGLGTCCLNWSAEYKIDRQLRQAANIPNSEVVIMMIAVGHIPERLLVAQSPRKSIEEVIVKR